MYNNELKALEWFALNNHSNIRFDSDALFIRPIPSVFLKMFKKEKITCYQPLQPFHNLLKEQGYNVIIEPIQKYDLIICLGTKFKVDNLYNFAKSNLHLKENGIFIFAISNDIGAKAYQNQLNKIFGSISVISKSKCRVFSGKKNNINCETLEEWLKLGKPHKIENTELVAFPGIFSANKIDNGSKLLIDSLSIEISGKGADLGAGYGYLSYAMLSKFKNITELHLYEVEYNALIAAKINLKKFELGTQLSFNWHDVTKGLLHRDLDWIITNPPFHQDKQQNISLGISFIKEAYTSLKKGGKLYLVANQHLPYENILMQYFKNYKEITQKNNFKVLTAIK